MEPTLDRAALLDSVVSSLMATAPASVRESKDAETKTNFVMEFMVTTARLSTIIDQAAAEGRITDNLNQHFPGLVPAEDRAAMASMLIGEAILEGVAPNKQTMWDILDSGVRCSSVSPEDCAILKEIIGTP